MKKILVILVILFVIVIGAGFVFKTFVGKKKSGDVRTAKVERSDISKTVVATGKIEPKSKIEVKSKIGGIVNKFFVEEGDTVKIGQKLAEVIPGATPIEMVRARNEVKAAAFNKENAEFLFKRAQKLLNDNLISKQEYEKFKTSYETAKSRYYSAMAQLQVLERGSVTSGIENELKLSEEDRKAVEIEAKEALASMTIISPIDGIVLSRDTDEGTAVIPISSAYGGTIIMTIADVSEVHFKGDVDEADIGSVKLGMPVRIQVESYPDKFFDAELTHISPLGREKNNIVNFEVKAKVKDDEKILRVGMTANAEIILARHKNTLVIPEGAIIYENGNAFVYKQDLSTPEGKKKIPVKVGITDGIKTEILEGLKEGDIVVFPE
ncbi:hypothetical protein DRQ09_04110 [candidate division KSB1 bacterium]|nr:MAG: hypothetical protein DRQ09_04110 [candidate division KSB1 bacterium]